MAVYLYGVGHRSLSPPADVVGVAPSTGTSRILVDGDLAALVTDLADHGPNRGPVATTANLAAHERVVDAAAEGGDFLPARFGLVADSDADLVTTLLRPRRAELMTSLARLSGKVELRLTVSFEGDDLLREAIARNPRVARLRRRVHGRPAAATYYDRIALGEAARDEVLRLQQRELEVLHARLAPIVAEQKLLAAPDGTTARMAYLVGTEDLDLFDDELEAYADDRDGRVRIDLLGPLAPWDFVELSGEPEGQARSAPHGRRRLERQGAR